MRRRWPFLVLLPAGVLTGFLLFMVPRLSDPGLEERLRAITRQTTFDEPPIYAGLLTLPDGGTGRRPSGLTFFEGKLLVSYLDADRIEEFSETFDHIRSFHLLQGEAASLMSIAAAGGRLYATDALSGELLISDYRTGDLIHSLGFLPDEKTRMKLTNVIHAAGNLYATDGASRQVLVISPSAVDGLRDQWELMLHFPAPSGDERSLVSPTASAMTPDGRLLVCDAGRREVKAFTCNGRYAHPFEAQGEARMASPMGLALDDVPSPALLAASDTLFQPSGIYREGRIHVVDAVLGRVKVFDALGSYVMTYGAELDEPVGIVINQKRRLVLIADAGLGAIAVYKY